MAPFLSEQYFSAASFGSPVGLAIFPYSGFEGQANSLLVCDAAAAYQPRNPEENPLYGVVSEHLETFLAMQRERDRPVPHFVERELRSFLDCGVLANGFLRVHCDVCRKDRVVPFSCKGRSLCSSCCGRRMADTAAHLVDRVLPGVALRQWVLWLPLRCDTGGLRFPGWCGTFCKYSFGRYSPY
jgi:hypothetical protein